MQLPCPRLCVVRYNRTLLYAQQQQHHTRRMTAPCSNREDLSWVVVGCDCGQMIEGVESEKVWEFLISGGGVCGSLNHQPSNVEEQKI